MLLWIFALVSQDSSGIDLGKIDIINTGKYMPFVTTNIDAGPATGSMLNFHYFPGINFYNGGRYKEAEQEFTYVILRPQYLEANPRRAEFMSTAYYLRGMIYAHHATGVGRYSLAKQDFEAALKWNPLNYIVYLEVSRLYSTLGFTEQAASILRYLLDMMPGETIVQEVQKELNGIAQKTP